MAKMCITIVLDADRATVRKVKNKVMKAAHKQIISCSATFLDPLNNSQPSEKEQLQKDLVDEFIKKYGVNHFYGRMKV